MSGKKPDKLWKFKAHQLLDEFERGARRGKLSQLGLAKACGVSRQTLWRAADVMQRLRGIARHELGTPSTKVARASAAMRVRSLSARVDELEQINARLTQNFLVLARVLDEHGIDLVELMGINAPDLASGSKSADWSLGK